MNQISFKYYKESTSTDFYIFNIFFTFNFDNHNNCWNFVNCILQRRNSGWLLYFPNAILKSDAGVKRYPTKCFFYDCVQNCWRTPINFDCTLLQAGDVNSSNVLFVILFQVKVNTVLWTNQVVSSYQQNVWKNTYESVIF